MDSGKTMGHPRVPLFPSLGEPGAWDELTLLAATVFLEAEGEPVPGPLAVAWVVRNRGDIHHAILGPEGRAFGDDRPWEAFSCWNDDYKPIATVRLSRALTPAWAWEAAAAALWRLLPDPTGGANHYLNVELTKKIRGGSLPKWFNPAKITVVIGHHTFLKL